MKINTSLTGNLVQYCIILFLTLTAIGILYPIMSHTLKLWDFSEALGTGIIMFSTFGGFGGALFIRRRAELKRNSK